MTMKMAAAAAATTFDLITVLLSD